MERVGCPDCSECRYWFGLHTLPGLGRARIRRLIEHFGSAQAAWGASERRWKAIKGFGSHLTHTALAARTAQSLDRELGRLRHHSIRRLCPLHAFPPRLREIHDPPTLLYFRGTLELLDRNAVAIVGSRKPSAHGVEMATSLAASLASAGITIVSGLAAGIDAAAHRGALEAGGRTIAVMGTGVDRIYPPTHARLAAQIERRGALLTEYPLGTEPAAGHFPQRNRLIAGWGMAVIVVEAPERSGALITARLAADEGRDVLIVPGDAGRKSCAGSNRLLQAGAGAVLTVDDVLFAIRSELRQEGWTNPLPAPSRAEGVSQARAEGMTGRVEGTAGAKGDVEGALLDLLDRGGPRSAESLVGRLERSAPEVQRALFHLEMAGLVRVTPTGEYVRSPGPSRSSVG